MAAHTAAYTAVTVVRTHNKQSPGAKRWVSGKPSEYSDDSLQGKQETPKTQLRPSFLPSVSLHLSSPPHLINLSPLPLSLSVLLCGSSWRLPVWCRWFVSVGFSLSGVSWLQWHNEELYLLRKTKRSQDFPFSSPLPWTPHPNFTFLDLLPLIWLFFFFLVRIRRELQLWSCIRAAFVSLGANAAL